MDRYPSTTVVAAGVALLLTTLLAYLLDPRLGVLLLGAPLIALLLLSPPAGTALLLFLLPLEELSAVVPGIRLSSVVGVGVVGGWLVNSLLRRRRIGGPAIALVPALFVLWASVSGMWAVDTDIALHQILTLLQLLGLYFLVTNVLDTPRVLHRALCAHVAGAVVLASLGLILTSEGVLQGGRTAIVVGGQLLVEPNGFAAALLVPVAVCMTLASDSRRSMTERLLLLLAGMLCTTALLLTMSRGAVVAVAMIAVAMAVARRRILLPVLGIALAAPGLLLVPPEFWQRWSNAVTLADRGAGRLDIWQVGWLVWRSDPLVGVGLGSFPTVYYQYLASAADVSVRHAQHIAEVITMAPHSIYLGAAAELGAIGFGLLAAMLWTHLLAAFRTWRRLEALDHGASQLALAVAAGLLALAVQGAFFDITLRKYFWTALGLAAAGAYRKLKPPARVTVEIESEVESAPSYPAAAVR